MSKTTNEQQDISELFIEELTTITGGNGNAGLEQNPIVTCQPPPIPGQHDGLGQGTTRPYGEEDGGYGINMHITNPNQLPSR